MPHRSVDVTTEPDIPEFAKSSLKASGAVAAEFAIRDELTQVDVGILVSLVCSLLLVPIVVSVQSLQSNLTALANFVLVIFLQRSMQSRRYDFDAEVVPTITTLALTICRWSSGNIFSFRSISDSMSLSDIGKIPWRSRRIESQVSLPVLLKLPLSDLGRSAGNIPGVTGGVQTILPLSNRIAHSQEACRHF